MTQHSTSQAQLLAFMWKPYTTSMIYFYGQLKKNVTGELV
eukprot:CAMPEP_0196180592 /NCGR_PEP_ID=MMETSP0911-20130528/24603_1 /TAXON_ID=49265 /ORGANISM="Thalassiosira rotula, Strain GSO102" /LENGTH=39 /DNA_ID= /DNA_START= /DNA_END= /DNA_ORIENTATION=